jgi:alcohol dehydrogenase class IV
MIAELATAQRIVFGPGKLAEAGDLAGALGKRALVVIGQSAGAAQRAEPLLAHLTQAGVDYSTFSISGEPTLATARAGRQRARQEACDFVIGFGGGSVMDAGKAIAALMNNDGDPLEYVEVIGAGKVLTQPSAPYMAIPTTAGTGAETTRNAVLGSPEHRVKVSLRSPTMLPRVALVDPELTRGLPVSLAVTTGMDALTQLMEAFVSCKANVFTDMICREGMRLAARSLVNAAENDDPFARCDMALAALYSGIALANAGLGAVHGLAGPLGGMYPRVAHGALCAALLPSVWEVNEQAASEKSRFEEARQIVGDVGTLARRLNVPGLRTLGVDEKDFPDVVERARASSSMKGNPVRLSDKQLMIILQKAM